MSGHRFTSQGTSWVSQPRLDRNRTRHTGAKFVRPEGEPPLWLGVLLLAVIIGAAVLAIVAFAPAAASSTMPRSEAVSPTTSAVEAGAQGGVSE